jgi:hypothetical protein
MPPHLDYTMDLVMAMATDNKFVKYKFETSHMAKTLRNCNLSDTTGFPTFLIATLNSPEYPLAA